MYISFNHLWTALKLSDITSFFFFIDFLSILDLQQTHFIPVRPSVKIWRYGQKNNFWVIWIENYNCRFTYLFVLICKFKTWNVKHKIIKKKQKKTKFVKIKGFGAPRKFQLWKTRFLIPFLKFCIFFKKMYLKIFFKMSSNYLPIFV